MSEPRIAFRQPAVLELEPGSYWWSLCGRSNNQPFCDGSHKDTEFSPIKLELTEAKTVTLCQCKNTANRPYCDGTHATLS